MTAGAGPENDGRADCGGALAHVCLDVLPVVLLGNDHFICRKSKARVAWGKRGQGLRRQRVVPAVRFNCSITELCEAIPNAAIGRGTAN